MESKSFGTIKCCRYVDRSYILYKNYEMNSWHSGVNIETSHAKKVGLDPHEVAWKVF